MKRIVFASGNNHKLKEIQLQLNNEIELISMRAMGYYGEIEETGVTLAENAAIKANFIHQMFHENTLSDDSGLEINSLNGLPGVYSARYAGEGCSFEDNNRKVLLEMNGIADRSATFKTLFHLIFNGFSHQFVGEISGRISMTPKGLNGFGYDSIFIPEGSDMTFAEMSAQEKNLISHRALATQKLVNFSRSL